MHAAVTFRSVPFRSVPFRSVPFRSVPFRSVPFRSVPFRSVPFRSVPFRSVPFRYVLHVWSNRSRFIFTIIVDFILAVLQLKKCIHGQRAFRLQWGTHRIARRR